MKTVRLPWTDACPFCRHKLDAATAGPGNPEAVPSPGAVTICIECHSVLIYNDAMRVRKPTRAELEEVISDPQLQRIIQTLDHFRPPARS